MTNKRKKIIFTLVAAFVVISVVSFYPTGLDWLRAVRSWHGFSSGDGKEVMYSFVDQGDITVADGILNNSYAVSRFAPVTMNTVTWTEDPYQDIYWRFNFYNLEPVRNLMYAWEQTHNPAYKDKALQLIESFIDTGMKGAYSWDLHGAAFRTMTLVDVYAKLKREHQLPPELDAKILLALEVHGQFLADPAHFESDYNHGLDQSAALYLLADNFPDLPGAADWKALASQRIKGILANVIDSDGVLVENSPYYHFYVLEKVWEINAYLDRYREFIADDFDQKITQMISYAAHVLQPNDVVPTIGASLQETINLNGVYADMAKTHPDLLYVLTQGKRGTPPANLSIHYPSGGETIMRSGWDSGDDFVNQTQLIYDVGSYRTNHSDLDALSFSLYSNGLTLMPDSGLYTYQAGPYRDYFHGTSAHNTVVVDGKDQETGEVSPGETPKVQAGTFEQGGGYTYQSGEEELNGGVVHERSIAMIGHSTILIFDNLESDSEHTYDQMFHLFPGATISTSTDGLTLTATASSTNPAQKLTIHQFVTDDTQLHTMINQQNPPNGICSFEYETAVPCYSVSYSHQGKDVSYVTAITIGQNQDKVSYDANDKSVSVTTKDGTYTVGANESTSSPRQITVDKNFNINSIYSAVAPVSILNTFAGWSGLATSTGQIGAGAVAVNTLDNTLEISTPVDGSLVDTSKAVPLDLSHQNLSFDVKIDDTHDLQGFDLYLSNDNWAESAHYDIRKGTYNIAGIERDNEWIEFSVPKGASRDPLLGDWVLSNPTFDWSKIDAVKLIASSRPGISLTINARQFSLVPDSTQGRVVIMFDDGWASVMDALQVMNKYGFKGNVAAISSVVGQKYYLTLDQLRELQNTYGWDIVNHSSLHKDAVHAYVDTNNLEGLNTDIADGLQYLTENNINSAPNWYVYPDGYTDQAVKNVVGKYYKFARSTVSNPETYPFPEPLEVKSFTIYSPHYDEPKVAPVDVQDAVADAVKYNQTLFLMFHKFTPGPPTVFTEYQLSQFDQILRDIKNQGISVVTLSELDKGNGVPETQFSVKEYEAPQISLTISRAGGSTNSLNSIYSWLIRTTGL